MGATVSSQHPGFYGGHHGGFDGGMHQGMHPGFHGAAVGPEGMYAGGAHQAHGSYQNPHNSPYYKQTAPGQHKPMYVGPTPMHVVTHPAMQSDLTRIHQDHNHGATMDTTGPERIMSHQAHHSSSHGAPQYDG